MTDQTDDDNEEDLNKDLVMKTIEQATRNTLEPGRPVTTKSGTVRHRAFNWTGLANNVTQTNFAN